MAAPAVSFWWVKDGLPKLGYLKIELNEEQLCRVVKKLTTKK